MSVRSFNNPMRKRIKIKDVASYCMVSKTTVRRWIKSGKLRAMRLPSGHYRINRMDYRRFLDSCDTQLEEDSFESKSKEERGQP
jgi:excisionase family DNA binding protein